MGSASNGTSLKTAVGPVSILNRDRLLALMRGAQSKAIEVVVVEKHCTKAVRDLGCPIQTAARGHGGNHHHACENNYPVTPFSFYNWTMVILS
jgi:hypothetical protein